ncbi:MAG: hypothetical protein Q9163_005043 [Psora crenata]
MEDITLNSDHVNYLIWRYLQESGYGDAAVRLQKFWLPGGDPQALPFAQRVDKHALVVLVHKGLRYHQIEHLHAKNGTVDALSDTIPPPVTLLFGPEIGRGATKAIRNEISDDAASPRLSARKHTLESHLNGLSLDLPSSGPTPKRSRRSNGAEATNGDAMQIDQNRFSYAHREPPEPISPGGYSAAGDGQANSMEIDEEADASATSQDPPPVPTLVDGQSIGIQSDQVLDLTPNTSILSVPDKDNVMYTLWSPTDPSILATGGDALCRIWSDVDVAVLADKTHQTSICDIIPPTDNSLVTSMAWSPDGRLLAVATRADASDWTGAVSTWTDDGKALDDLIAGQDMVIKLRWNATGTLLLGVTSNGNGGSSLIIWEMQSSQPFPPIPCDKVITDATWTGDGTITVCGQGAIGRCDMSSGLGLTWGLGNDQTITDGHWSHISYDALLDITAIADEENGHLVFLDGHGGVNGKDAHKDAITAITYQPIPSSAISSQTPRILVTSSLDGTIRYWDARTARLLHTLTFGRDSPPLAIAFSPDGVLLAAASYNKILIWNTEEGSMPKASWKGELGRLPKMMLANGNGADRDSGIGDDEDGMNEPNCSLDWDNEGKKLALGVGNQIAIICVQP